MIVVILGMYVLFILSYALVSFFIIYHLVKYSINSRFSRTMVIFFSILSLLILISNISLFFSVDWNSLVLEIFPNTFDWSNNNF
ncbi:MAG: hypothetical protein WAV73_03000 [Candidatus Moraniibacteriota bacterium]